jgi:DNA-binding CsgD family transcriptional regulator/predicted negative regulator of RcsB-dependent stress response
MYAPRAALEHFTRAWEAAHQLHHVLPPRFYHQRGQAYDTLGKFEQACSDYERALAIAHKSHDDLAEWQSLLDLGLLWTGRDYQRAGGYFQTAAHLAQSFADRRLLARSLNRLGNWHLNLEQPLEALRYHQEALAIFQELQDRPALAETFDLLGMANYLGGDLIQSQWSCEQASALFRELDNRQGLVSNLPTLMICSGNYFTETAVSGTKSLAETLPFGELALSTAREIGSRADEAYILLALAMCLGPRGEYTRALELAQRALEIAKQIEHRQWMSCIHWGLGRLYLDLLAVPASHRHLEQALALAHELGSEFWVHIASGLLALTFLLQHDVAGAEAVLTTALGPDSPAHTLGQRLVWYARAELALASGKTSRALDSTNQLISSAKNVSAEQTIPLLFKFRGEVLVALKQLPAAETALRTAKQSAMAQGARSILWRIEVALGKLYQSQRHDRDAVHAFASAQQTIEQLAAPLADLSLRDQFLQQATALLPQTRQLSSQLATRRAYGGLTEREREVAILIAQGKSNREIADSLTITERTAETHVRNILNRLGLTSRIQIALWVITTGLTDHVG